MKSAEQNFTHFSHYIITSFFLILACSIMLQSIDRMHLRPDEILTFSATETGLASSIYGLSTRDVHAPLWFINIWVWQRLVGTGEYVNRLNGIFLSMLTLALIYQMGRTWFTRPHAGWFALMLTSTNTYFLIYALEIRPYPLAMFTAALCMYRYGIWLRSRVLSHAILYALSAALLVYVHYYLAFLIVAQSLYFALFHLTKYTLVKQGIVAAFVALITVSPQLAILKWQLTLVRFTQGGTAGVPTEPSNWETVQQLIDLGSTGLPILYGLIIILGFFLLRMQIGFHLILVWLFLTPSLVFLLNLKTPVYTQRYIAFIAPAIGLMGGSVIAMLGAYLQEQYRSQKRIVASLIGLCLLSLWAFTLVRIPETFSERAPLRTIYRTMSEITPGNASIYFTHQDRDGFEREHIRRYMKESLANHRIEQIDPVNTPRHIWFITSDWFNPQVRAEFDQLSQTHRLEQVLGDCKPEWCYLAQLMTAPPLRDPVWFGEIMGFQGADIYTDDTSVKALLWWSVERIPQRDYSISLRILDDNQTLVAQTDRQIQPDPQSSEIPTSHMEPGNIYIDARTIQLPDSLPQGKYEVHLVVYHWQNKERLTLSNGDDTLKLHSITIGS